jgi:hypothetical protein
MDMYNWDIVCATSCEAVNYELEQSRNLMISDFSYTHDSGDYITGVFGNWQIVPGGSSQRINFITPIKKGKLRHSFDSTAKTSLPSGRYYGLGRVILSF